MKPKSTRARVMASLARNGTNTILLDLKEDIGIVKADVRHLTEAQVEATEFRKDLKNDLHSLNISVNSLAASVVRMEPIVATLNAAHQQKIGLGDLFKRIHAGWVMVGGGVVACAAWLWSKLT